MWLSALLKLRVYPAVYHCSHIDCSLAVILYSFYIRKLAVIADEKLSVCRQVPTLQQSFPAAAISSSRLVSAISGPRTSVCPLLILSSSQLVEKWTTSTLNTSEGTLQMPNKCNWLPEKDCVIDSDTEKQPYSQLDLDSISEIMRFMWS